MYPITYPPKYPPKYPLLHQATPRPEPEIDGDSFTKLSALDALPNTGMGCAFSPDGTYLAVAHIDSPYITVYQKDIHEPL